MKRFELEYLRVLTAFADSKNLVEAAAKLRISQPAVTQRLQRLQAQVPQPLFSFSGRKKVLTHYGKAFYEHARATEVFFDQGLENLNRRYATAQDLVLRVGGRKELFEIFSSLVHFSGRIDYTHLSEPEAVQAVSEDRLDIALTQEPSASRGMLTRKIAEGASRFAFRTGTLQGIHSFRDLQSRKAVVARAPCIFHKSETRGREGFARYFGMDSRKLNCRALLEDWQSIQALVESGAGFSVLPAFVRPHSNGMTYFEVPHSVIPYSSYYAVYPKKLMQIEAFKRALGFSVQSS